MHEELGAQEFAEIILRGEIWRRSEDENGILNRSALFICLGIGGSEGSVEQRNILSIYQIKEEKDRAPD